MPNWGQLTTLSTSLPLFSNQLFQEFLYYFYHPFSASIKITQAILKQAGIRLFRIKIITAKLFCLQFCFYQLFNTKVHMKILVLFALYLQILLGVEFKAGQEETFLGKIFCGYQAWFTAANDGTNNGWTHYKVKSSQALSKTNCVFDFYPDSTDYPIKYDFPEVGSKYPVFSPNDYSTVQTHFFWMKQYNIDGIFLQRFGSDIRNPGSNIYKFKNNVFENVRKAAKQSGKLWALMYDLSGLKSEEISSVIMKDWEYLNSQVDFRSDSSYIKHEGKPLIAVWGLGFSDHRNYTLNDCQQLVEFLKTGKYGGNSVMLGVPRFWKDGGGDTVSGSDLQKLHQIILQSDVVSPWTVGRYADKNGIEKYALTVGQQVKWCEQNKLQFFPVIFPGFSWHNLQTSIQKPDNPGPYDQIPRYQNGSYFLEEQGKAFIKQKAKSLYVAMFDQINEGTAIFKCLKIPPVFSDGLKFVGYGEQSSDFYLSLTGKIGKLLKASVEVQE